MTPSTVSPERSDNLPDSFRAYLADLETAVAATPPSALAEIFEDAPPQGLGELDAHWQDQLLATVSEAALSSYLRWAVASAARGHASDALRAPPAAQDVPLPRWPPRSDWARQVLDSVRARARAIRRAAAAAADASAAVARAAAVGVRWVAPGFRGRPAPNGRD